MARSDDNHRHIFELKPATNPYYCGKCNQIGFGSSYSCKHTACNVVYHEQCENPRTLVEYPFSKKCVLKFHTNGSEKDCLCDVCGKKIKGCHYKCMCKFMKRHVHPSCLSYEATLVAMDGLTLHLNKVATSKCLHCGTKDLWSSVPGWAYVSSCGEFCYHVSCVNEIINSNWRNAVVTGKSDPFLCIKQKCPGDMGRTHQLVIGGKKEKPTRKKVTAALSAIFNVLTGNPFGLIGDAQSYFSN